MKWLIWLIALVFDSAIAQNHLPSVLQPLAAFPVLTSLRRILYGEKRPSLHIAGETFRYISGKWFGAITEVEMYQFVNRSMTKIATRFNESSISKIPADQVASTAMKWLLVGTEHSEILLVNRTTFLDRIHAVLDNQTIATYPTICDAYQQRTLSCQSMTGDVTDLKRVWNHIKSRVSTIQSQCKVGMTALGGYRIEACAIGIPFDPFNVSLDTCKLMTQCFLTSLETKWNPWNLTSPYSEVHFKQQPPLTVDLVAVNLIIGQYLTEYYQTFKSFFLGWLIVEGVARAMMGDYVGWTDSPFLDLTKRVKQNSFAVDNLDPILGAW